MQTAKTDETGGMARLIWWVFADLLKSWGIGQLFVTGAWSYEIIVILNIPKNLNILA